MGEHLRPGTAHLPALRQALSQPAAWPVLALLLPAWSQGALSGHEQVRHSWRPGPAWLAAAEAGMSDTITIGTMRR